MTTVTCNMRSSVYLSSLIAVFSSLSGCISSHGISPQAHRLDDAELITDHAINAAARAADWPDAKWWQAYGDPQLNAWVELALANSPSLAEAGARVRRAQALAGVAEAVESPQMDMTAEIQRKRWPKDPHFYGPGVLSGATTWNGVGDLGFIYNLDLWGALRNNEQRALDVAQLSATEERAAALELQHSVVRSYIQLAMYHAELKIAKAALEQREQLLHLSKQRLRMGLGTEFEVSEAESPIPEAHRQVDLLEEAIKLTQNQLAALAGKGPEAGERLTPPTLALHAEPELPSTLPLELVGKRPDIVASRWLVAAEARGIEVAKADFYPNLNLKAALGGRSAMGGILEMLTRDKLTYSIGPALNVPVFDGGRRRGQLQAATAGYDQAVEQYNQTLVSALKNISDHLVRLHSLHEQQGFVHHGIETASLRYQLAQEAYRRGLSDYRGVLEAQTLLFDQQRLQEQIRAAQLSTHAGLWVELGGGVLDGQANASPDERQLTPRAVELRNPLRHSAE